jgi:glucose-1-phosphate adenylyltransferase
MLTQPNAPFSFYDPTCPIYTHERFLPPSRLLQSDVRTTLVSDGSYLEQSSVSDSIIGIRTIIRSGARIRRSVLLGADKYEQSHESGASGTVPLGIGTNVELDRVIVDKNARIGSGARLINTKGVQEHDGDGFYIRNGIIVVPKDGVIPAGFSI